MFKTVSSLLILSGVISFADGAFATVLRSPLDYFFAVLAFSRLKQSDNLRLTVVFAVWAFSRLLQCDGLRLTVVFAVWAFSRL